MKERAKNFKRISPPVHGDRSSATGSNLNAYNGFFSNNNNSLQVAVGDVELANKRPKLGFVSNPTTLECHCDLGEGSSTSTVNGDGDGDGVGTFDSCELLSDIVIRSAVCSCPLLTTLEVPKLLCLTEERISQLAQTCVQFCKINVSGCPKITFESIRLPLLTVLKLDNCESIQSVSMVALSHSNMLHVGMEQLVSCLEAEIVLDLVGSCYHFRPP